MIPKVSSLHLQSLGLPDNATKCSVLLNHNMKHYVKAKAGVTKEFYKHEEHHEKFGGTGQNAINCQLALSELNTIISATSLMYQDTSLSYCAYVAQRDQENETLTRIRDRMEK
eukprot:7193423-Ditylum_brightwellii.AAC.1